MREKRDRDEYCDADSEIIINRGFAVRLTKLLKGTIEADQLENIITKNRERVKSKQYEKTFDRPFIS